MATTKIWPIKGALSHPIAYVENEEKTVMERGYNSYSVDDLSMLEHITDFAGQSREKAALERALGYSVNPTKTDNRKLVSGINCHAENALAEMNAVKERFHKDGGVVCYHGYQSFAEGEVTPGEAHRIGIETAKAAFGEQYQVVVATHMNTVHPHNHFVVNSVSFTSGKKRRGDFREADILRVTSDRICREHGLSVITPKRGRLPNPAVYKELGEEPPKPRVDKVMLRYDIDDAIAQARTFGSFCNYLRSLGYYIRPGKLKHFTLCCPGDTRHVRVDTALGEEYTMEHIRERIDENRKAATSPRYYGDDADGRSADSTAQQDNRYYVPHWRFRGSFAKLRKRSLRQQYLYICFGFYVPKQYRTRYPAIDKREVQKLRRYSEKALLLSSAGVDSEAQLKELRDNLKEKARICHNSRKSIYLQRSKETDPEARSTMQEGIDEVNAQIRELNRQVRLCNDILLQQEQDAQYRDRAKEHIIAPSPEEALKKQKSKTKNKEETIYEY